jgi:hypothetical protein
MGAPLVRVLPMAVLLALTHSAAAQTGDYRSTPLRIHTDAHTSHIHSRRTTQVLATTQGPRYTRVDIQF